MSLEVDRRMVVAASVDDIIALASRPRVQLRVIPGLLEVHDVRAGPDGEMRAEYLVQLACTQIRGTARTIPSRDRGQVGLRTDGELQCRVTVTAEPASATETEVSLRVALEAVPRPLSGILDRDAYLDEVAHQAGAALRGIRISLEAA